MPNDTSTPGSSPAGPDYRKAVQKSEDRWTLRYLQINRLLNRPIAAVIVYAVFRTRITPNQVTWAACVIGLAGAGCLFVGRPAWFLAGGILTQLSSVMDCADGMLARARDEGSEFGAYLDLCLDRVNEFFLLTGCAIGYYRFTGRMEILLIGLIGTALYFLQTSVFYLLKHYQSDSRKGESAENRGWLMFLIAAFSATTRLDLGLSLFLVITVVANVVQVVAFLRKQPA